MKTDRDEIIEEARHNREFTRDYTADMLMELLERAESAEAARDASQACLRDALSLTCSCAACDANWRDKARELIGAGNG